MLAELDDPTILKERYQITHIVGQGGMGKVYRAEDLRLPGRLCAIKEIRPESNAPEKLRDQERDQFLREASLLAQLDHPNLPKVSDFFSESGSEYLVMDYVPGKNLKERIDDQRARGRTLEVETVMIWAEQIMDAVTYLHDQDPPVLHRDIKPANIKLTPDNRIKLVDFGLAKVLAGDDSSTITVIQGRGTAFYTPLEQYGAESEHTDARSDLYALAATFYHLFSGNPPPEAKERFLNPNVMQDLYSLNDQVDKNVTEAIHWALEMHPNDRPSSIDDFKLALRIGHRSTSPRNSENQDRLMPAFRSNWVLLLITIGLFIVAVLLTVF